MSMPAQVKELIKRFEDNIEAYRSGKYNETQIRLEFIDPFFTALGWDVHNKQGFAEAYKDVIHEDAIKIGGNTKAPDYCFRIGGARKFFLEAKKPSINIKVDISPSYQLRRYAWSAKLPLSVLTDFEELAIYDCRSKPLPGDMASAGRILYFNYKEYADRWDEIASVFTKEAVLKGSFDKFAQTTKGKRGTAEVDNAFLQEIESWRDILARNIALRNRGLSQRELNYAVQITIDRIIFLRISEDRGIEQYGRLQALLNGNLTYDKLKELYKKADEKYNSGLFHFSKEDGRPEACDDLTPKLKIDDKVLKDIINRLYFPQSPYEFSVLPSDILGQVYEQFLGKVIRLTPGGQAVVEDKPEVKKAGGVYYTPTYIVDYIVKNTVGKLLEGKTPKQAAELKILDPACGSGSFLIGAYHYLTEWHRNYYVDDGVQKHKKVLFQAQGGDYRLTTAEKKRILLNNIYGVDIDSQAVEVTKLSLLLKVLEGESEETINSQLRLFHERALPDLGNNIKCGNSLIGPDYYENKQLNLMDEEERYRVNAFDWQREFPNVFPSPLMGEGQGEGDKDNGFDAVIGNPPWGAFFSDTEINYIKLANDRIINRMIDSFMFFVYQSTLRLISSGYLGMILPDVILYQVDNKKLRTYLLENYQLTNLLNLGDVFEKVNRPASIIIAKGVQAKKSEVKVADLTSVRKNCMALEIQQPSNFQKYKQELLNQIPNNMFITSNIRHYEILNKINELPVIPLEEVADEDGIQRGVSPDYKSAFILDKTLISSLEKNKLKKVITGGRQVNKYIINYTDLYLIYTTRNDDFNELPNICAFIDQFKSKISCKEVIVGKHPIYALHRPRCENIFTKPKKIVGVITEDEIKVALDDQELFCTDGLYLFGTKNTFNSLYIIAILNSQLFKFLYRLFTLERGRSLAQVKPTILNKLPIRSLNEGTLEEQKIEKSLIVLVENMLELNKQLVAAKMPGDKTAIQRQIDATDHQIDQLVYKLYGLTEKEIKIIEKSAK